MDEEFEKLRNEWYHNDDVAFNIIDRMKYREGVFLRKNLVHRCLKINKVEFFFKNAERYHFFTKEPFNLYSSLSLYPNLPMFSFARAEKRKQMDDFNVAFPQYMTGYDFLIDVDNEDLDLAYSTAFKIKKILDDRKIEYWLMFSGNKGFHFRVDYEDFPQEMKVLEFDTLAKKFKTFAENFKEIEQLPDIDTSIFDLRRIAKAPYSVVYPNYLVAYPLTDNQFEKFNIVEMTLPYRMEHDDTLHRRGVLKRKGTKRGFMNLINDYTRV